jgi:transposase-like protein
VAGRPQRPLASRVVSDEDRTTLTTWIRSSTVSAGDAERAAIVLACADGAGTSDAARTPGVSRPTVIEWRDRLVEHGIAGLGDEPRSGRPKTVDDVAIIAATLDPPPERLGVSHLSTRLLARHLGVGDATVARSWAPVSRPAMAARDVRVQHRPRARGQGPRRRHFTPTSGPWLDLVEVFFGIITRRAIRRGSNAGVPQLVAAIRAFIDGWNERCHPFVWTKTADEILPHTRA